MYNVSSADLFRASRVLEYGQPAFSPQPSIPASHYAANHPVKPAKPPLHPGIVASGLQASMLPI